MARTKSLLLSFCVLGAAAPLLADNVPYPDRGIVAPTTELVADQSGIDVSLYFYGSSASVSDSLQIYDIDSGYVSTPFFNNHTTTSGTMVSVGTLPGQINAGDELVFYIDTPGGRFASDPTSSSDGINHTYVADYAGGTVGGNKIPAGLFLGFEDQRYGISDLDYNDVEILANGVTAVTPEPSGLLLFGTGLLGVVGAIRRRYA